MTAVTAFKVAYDAAERIGPAPDRDSGPHGPVTGEAHLPAVARPVGPGRFELPTS